MATCAPNASPALAAPLVPAPRLPQGWWAEQCGTARLVDQSSWIPRNLRLKLAAFLNDNAAATGATPSPVALFEILHNARGGAAHQFE